VIVALATEQHVVAVIRMDFCSAGEHLNVLILANNVDYVLFKIILEAADVEHVVQPCCGRKYFINFLPERVWPCALSLWLLGDYGAHRHDAFLDEHAERTSLFLIYLLPCSNLFEELLKNIIGLFGLMDDLKDKVHYIAVTGIVRKDDKYLICKRSDKERIFPGKWCVPGGKVTITDFIHTPKDTKDHWFGVLEKTLAKEIFEETNIRIKNIGYVSNLALLRPNGYSTIIISLHAQWDSGEAEMKQPDELVDFAWVTLEEAKEYDLIENIWEQIEKVEKKYQ
jgi:8-oxo-dGTP diphosphatase